MSNQKPDDSAQPASIEIELHDDGDVGAEPVTRCDGVEPVSEMVGGGE